MQTALYSLPQVVMNISQFNALQGDWLSSRNFFQGEGGNKICCYASLYCNTHLSIVFGPNVSVGEAKVSVPPPPPLVEESQVN